VVICLNECIEDLALLGDQLVVSGTHGLSKTADFVLVAVGVQPNSELGATADAAVRSRLYRFDTRCQVSAQSPRGIHIGQGRLHATSRA
jgi:hypothetical protein